MYGNLIYILLVLVIFGTYQPVSGPELPWWAGLGFNLVLPVCYWLLSRSLFQKLRNRVLAGTAASPSLHFHRAQLRLSVLAIILFTVHVYNLELKDALISLPGAGRSEALAGLLGLAVFSLYLSLLWVAAFDAYVVIFRTRLNRFRFVWSRLRFNLLVILPYLLLALAGDAIGLLPPEGELRAWLESPVGELISIMVFISIIVTLFPALVRPLWGLTPLPPGPPRDMIEAFYRELNFKYREIMLWPLYEGEGMTAGVMGLAPRWRYILVTQSLLSILDPDELRAVMAHELGHVRHRHMQLYLFLFLGYLVPAYAFFDFNIMVFMFSGQAADILLNAGENPTALSLLLAAPSAVLLILYFRFIIGFFMRNFERQADQYAFHITGTVKGLIGSLEKIAFYSGQSRNVPSWHHFSIAQRVAFLTDLDRNPALGKKHDAKVRRMLVTYGLSLVLIAGGGYFLHQNGFSYQVNLKLAVSLYEARTRQSPNDAQVHRNLGDIYFQSGRLDPALAAYERAIELAPRDPEIMNNLAWALATREGASVEDKARALALAETAARLKPEPFILDTLAEALFQNGRPSEALRVIETALALNPDRELVEHLTRQKEKFRSTARDG